MSERISADALSRETGVSSSTIRKLVKSGLFSYGADGKLAREEALKHIKLKRPDIRRRQAGDGAGRESYESARARRESASADIRELELAERRGELVRLADVESALGARVISARSVLLAAVERLAPRLAATSDQREVHRLLSAEVVAALEQISTPGG